MKNIALRYLIILAALALTLACAGRTTTSPTTPNVPGVTSLSPTETAGPSIVPGTVSKPFSGNLSGDIINEVGFYAASGMVRGGDCNFTPKQAGIAEMYLIDNIYVTMGEPPVLGKEIPISHGDISWCACGLNPGAAAAILTAPDGTNQSLGVQESPFSDATNRCVSFLFPVQPGIQLGTYQVRLQNGKSILTDDFTLQMPLQPGSVWKDDSAWFIGLQPGEKVRLLVFAGDPQWKFLGEQALQADRNGRLLVQFEHGLSQSQTVIAAADGEKSGRVILSSKPVLFGAETVVNAFFKSCAGGMPTRLVQNGSAVVLQDDLPLYKENFIQDSGIIARLKKNVIVRLVGNAFCTDVNGWLWNIQAPDGTGGWVSEGDTTTYFLEPR